MILFVAMKIETGGTLRFQLERLEPDEDNLTRPILETKLGHSRPLCLYFHLPITVSKY